MQLNPSLTTARVTNAWTDPAKPAGQSAQPSDPLEAGLASTHHACQATSHNYQTENTLLYTRSGRNVTPQAAVPTTFTKERILIAHCHIAMVVWQDIFLFRAGATEAMLLQGVPVTIYFLHAPTLLTIPLRQCRPGVRMPICWVCSFLGAIALGSKCVCIIVGHGDSQDDRNDKLRNLTKCPDLA